MTSTTNDATPATTAPVATAATTARVATAATTTPVVPVTAAPVPGGAAAAGPVATAPAASVAAAPVPGGAANLGPALGRAERAMTRLLVISLAETGTPLLTWYAIQRLVAIQPAPTPAELRQDLHAELDLDDAAAAALLAEILAAGLMHEVRDAGDGEPPMAADGETKIALTVAGIALRDRVRASIAAVSGDLVMGLDQKNLDITVQTLTELLDRARARHTQLS